MEELEAYEKEALLQELRVKWIYNSNAIEGNTLSEGETSFIIEHGLTVQGKSLIEHNQVLGHMRAIELVYAMLDKEKIADEDIFLLHKAIQTEVLIDYERPNGAYKVVANGRWIHKDGKAQHVYYPLPEDIPHLMALWFDAFGTISQEITSKEQAIKIYADMHISFAAIHPFHDGNGRLARLISNLPLLKNGYLPIIIDAANRATYIDLLSDYNLSSKPLDGKTSRLLENSDAYVQLLDFFAQEYRNSEKLLERLRESKRELEAKRQKTKQEKQS